VHARSHLVVPHHDRDLFTVEKFHVEGDEPMVSFQFPDALHGFDLSIDDTHRLIDTLREVIRSSNTSN
jgi:hypothetical protein